MNMHPKRPAPADLAAHKDHRHARTGTKTLNLALQGGGAHGAFTWGVLDRLLEEDRLHFEGVVATSAGAMNAAVLAYGLAEGGRTGAQKALANFWRRVSHAAAFGPLQPMPWERWTGARSLENSPNFVLFDIVTRILSPYQFNPMNYNPLRSVLEESIDLAAVQSAKCPLKVHVCATNVRTGKVKVFSNSELTVDSILASACLPFLFQAVEIEGEAYWDGGYMGNPAIFPLIYNCESPDVLIVHINPIERMELPRTAFDILNRINEISFNSSLLREMRAIAFVTELIDREMACDLNLKRILVHSISDDETMQSLSAASKLNADWEALTDLRDKGRACADQWLVTHFDSIGRRSSVDIGTRYL